MSIAVSQLAIDGNDESNDAAQVSSDHTILCTPERIDLNTPGASNVASNRESDNNVDCNELQTLVHHTGSDSEADVTADPSLQQQTAEQPLETPSTPPAIPTAPSISSDTPSDLAQTAHPGDGGAARQEAAGGAPSSPLPRNGSTSPVQRTRSSILLRTATSVTAASVAAAAAAAAAAGGAEGRDDSPRPKGLRVSFCEQLEESVALLPPPAADDAAEAGPRPGPERVGGEGSACCAVM